MPPCPKISVLGPLSISPTRRDLSHKKGTVSRNVRAQFGVVPSTFGIHITIYDENIDEETLAHEALHAYLMVEGFPFFYRRNFPEIKTISSLDNSIQHLYIFQVLENMGYSPRFSARRSWKDVNVK